MISANNTSLEGVDYATAVQVLRDSGQTVNLVVKRRVVLPAPPQNLAPTSLPADMSTLPSDLRISLSRNRKKEDFGLVLGCKIYVKEIVRKSVADKDGSLHEGDLIYKINNTSMEGLSLKDARKLIEAAKDKLDIVVKRDSPNKIMNGKKISHKNGYGSLQPDEMKKTPYATPPVHEAISNYATSRMNGDTATPPRPPPPVEDGKHSQKLAFLLHVLNLVC